MGVGIGRGGSWGASAAALEGGAAAAAAAAVAAAEAAAFEEEAVILRAFDAGTLLPRQSRGGRLLPKLYMAYLGACAGVYADTVSVRACRTHIHTHMHTHTHTNTLKPVHIPCDEAHVT